jgi:SAM-dependent methyltransferase
MTPLELTRPNAVAMKTPDMAACPACGSVELIDFYESRQLPVHVGLFYDSPEEARRAPKGHIRLAYCRGCGFVHNRVFDVSRLSFEPGYEVALCHSAMFQSFMEGVARRLIDRYDLVGKRIIEIGCGAGWFLRLLCRLGGNQGTGFDTSVPKAGEERVGEGSVRFIGEYFTEKYADLPCDFMCCLSVLEAIPNPAEFLCGLRRIIGDRPLGGMYFEVFNAFRAFGAHETWSIHYEQCNYFSLDSFTGLFERCGFRVLDASTCYGDGQYLFVEAVPAESAAQFVTTTVEQFRELPDEARGFVQRHNQKLADWNHRLAEFRRDRRRVVVWGSGGKGISFLNILPAGDVVEYVVDINPDRQQKYLPGSGQRIVPPEFLVDYRPDTIILTNPLYEQEIREQVDQLRIHCEFLTA